MPGVAAGLSRSGTRRTDVLVAVLDWTIVMDTKTRQTYKKIYEWAEKAERPGGEFDWFAVDSDGCLAAFATAGFGPVPDSFFSLGLNSYLTLVGLIDDKLQGTRSVHSGGFLPYSERGFYAYDFRANESDQYEIAEIPGTPLRLLEAVELGFNQNMFVEFAGKFSESKLVIPEEFWNCR